MGVIKSLSVLETKEDGTKKFGDPIKIGVDSDAISVSDKIKNILITNGVILDSNDLDNVVAEIAKTTYNVNTNMTASDGTPFRFGVDSDGNYGYITQDEDGADTVNPFKSGSNIIYLGQYTGNKTIDVSAYVTSRTTVDDFYFGTVTVSGKSLSLSNSSTKCSVTFGGLSNLSRSYDETSKVLTISGAECSMALSNSSSWTDWQSIDVSYTIYMVS
jgi:hypothetical protein